MKKLVTILLVALMAFALFAGAQSEAAPKTSGSELKGPGNVVLRRLGYNVNFDVNKNYMVPVYEQATGYKVEYFALPAENADEKLLLEISSGKNYDIVNLNINQYRTLVSNGALMPLDDLLNTYGQDILKGNDKEVWDALRGSDGKIYGVPYMHPYPNEVTTFLTARMDLLKKAGINTIPKTIDEFENVLKTLKSFYGDQYIILAGPYRVASEGAITLSIPTCITSAFGIYGEWMEQDGKVIYMTEHPNFEKMVETFSRWSKAGYLDPDWAANTASSVTEKFASGKAIMTAGDRTLAQATVPVLMSNLKLTEEDFGFISALEGTDGTCTFMKATQFGKVSAVLKSSKNAADAINWINLKVKDQLFINIGVEGKHFYYDEAGQIAPINPIFADERGDSYYYLDATDAKAFMFQWPSRVRKSAGQWMAFSAVTLKDNAERPWIFVENPFAFMPPKANFARYSATLANALDGFFLQAMAGTRTVRDIPGFMADLKSMNIEAVRAELQDYLNSK